MTLLHDLKDSRSVYGECAKQQFLSERIPSDDRVGYEKQTKNVSVQVKSGQGKTLIIMLLAMVLRHLGHASLIFFVNQMLYEQLNFENSLYFSEQKLDI